MTGRSGILKDVQRDEALWETGFAVFPFLDAAAVDRLQSRFSELHPAPPDGLYATVHGASPELSLEISRLLAEVCRPAVESAFNAATLLGGVFLSKGPGAQGVLQPHQDWNIVDEKSSRSFNVWVPLVDTSEENGTIQVIPGSHRWMETIRGVNIPSAYDKVRSIAWEYMQKVPMKAGDAMIYDHALLHASAENRTRTHRVAAVLAIAPESADLKYYYLRDEKIERFSADANFYLAGNPPQGPAGLESEGFVGYGFPEVGEAQLRELAEANRSV